MTRINREKGFSAPLRLGSITVWNFSQLTSSEISPFYMGISKPKIPLLGGCQKLNGNPLLSRRLGVTRLLHNRMARVSHNWNPMLGVVQVLHAHLCFLPNTQRKIVRVG